MGFLLAVAVLLSACAQQCLGTTDSQDTSVLRALMDQWQNAPPSWGQSDDPCGESPWEGVTCGGDKVISIKLSTMGIQGSLAADIGQLSDLQSMDLSFNNELGGVLTPTIGNLKQLTTLILSGCSFHGTIPDELGSLPKLSYMALNSNQFSGKIPASLGNLSSLYWFDIADNQLSGPLPVSTDGGMGLDKLIKTRHFHFNKNQLSGPIPDALFSPEMALIHLLFDGNRFTGNIPDSLGFVSTLEVVRLDRNSLSGQVPLNLNNLTKVNELNLANNQLTGTLPDLSKMDLLNYVDLSNNTFDPSPCPAWFWRLPQLSALIIQSGRLYGTVPTRLFSSPQLNQVILDGNAFNGTLDMGRSISSELSLVSFKDNEFSSLTVTSSYNGTLALAGNPVCERLPNTPYCSATQRPLSAPYSTSLVKCYSGSCPAGQSLSPQSCLCAYPYQGVMYFRAPFFHDVANDTAFQELESMLWTKLALTPGSVYLQDPFFNSDAYMQVQVKLFPAGSGAYFNRSEVMRIGFDLSNQTFKPPKEFGPYYFIASPYPFPGSEQSSKSKGVIVGIAVGCGVLFVALAGAAAYAFIQRRRAEKAKEELGGPFASWARSEERGGAPRLKGARWFSYEELKRSTNNFAEANELGYGGYGKVYRGMLPTGQFIAIKRAQQGSMQGGHEFKTEIELLSRVHHKNLVGLLGFCFEQGEQMLVYEFMSGGTLRDSLAGKSGLHLDWKKRLRVALGAARGLAYLHELADPPIIHRDVKSSNILMDEHLTAKVADFGLSKLVSDSERGHVSTQVKGTLGYLDPEYYMSQQLTEKSDVYSFGVVMLELIVAKQPIEKGKYIVREAKRVFDADDAEFCGLKDMVDARIMSTNNHLAAFGKFVQLALRCVDEVATARPSMSEVVKEIEMMLQSEGLSSASTSASTSATEFDVTKGAPRHPYNDPPLPKKDKDVSTDSFEYSGGYSFQSKVEPK